MGTITYQQEYKDDKKSDKRYGPYWYAYWREKGKLKKKYLGKQLPKDVQDQQQQLTLWETSHGPQSKGEIASEAAHLEQENKRLKATLKDAERASEYWQHETLGRDEEIETLQQQCREMTRTIDRLEKHRKQQMLQNDQLRSQVAALEAEQTMVVAQRDSLIYDLPKPTDSEKCQFTQRLHRDPESIRDFIKRTRYRKEHLAWLLSTHYEELDQLGVRFGEPHAGTKESGLWLMTGQIITSLWWENQKV